MHLMLSMAELSGKSTHRKAELLVQSALLREKLAVEALSVTQMPDVVSRGLNLWNRFSQIGKKPVLIGVLVLAFLVIKPRRMVSWLFSVTVLFKTWKRFSPVIMPVIGYLMKRRKQ